MSNIVSKIISVIPIISGILKLVTFQDTLVGFRSFVPIPSMWVGPMLALVCAVELIIGLYAFISPKMRSIAVLGFLYLIFSIFMGIGIALDWEGNCFCFGKILQTGWTFASLLRNIALALTCLFLWLSFGSIEDFDGRILRQSGRKSRWFASVSVMTLLMALSFEVNAIKKLEDSIRVPGDYWEDLLPIRLNNQTLPSARKSVGLVFFNPECSLCQDESFSWPMLERELKKRCDIGLIAVLVGDSTGVGAFISGHRLGIPVFRLTDACRRRWNITTVPEYVIVSENGVLFQAKTHTMFEAILLNNGCQRQ
jgi:hypothetical protein